MKHPNAGLLILSITVFTLSIFAGCLSNKAIRLSDKELYSLGQKQFTKKKYIKARETFTMLVDNYPDSAFSSEAQLLKADAYYKERNYIEAGVEFGLFLEFHPAHAKADYALYQEADCNYHHIHSIDRDQTNVHETIRKLRKLIALYPDSPFIPSAKERLDECTLLLEAHSLYVARFYERWKEYRASLVRYDLLLSNKDSVLTSKSRQAAEKELTAVRKTYYDLLVEYANRNYSEAKYYSAMINLEELLRFYPDEEQKEEVLYQLARSYHNLKKYDEARDYYSRIVIRFSEGKYAEECSNYLKEIDIEEKNEEKNS